MTTKKKTTKKTTVKKETISGRQIGRNVIVTIGKDKYSRAFPVKKERQAVLDLIEAFNKRNSKAKKAEIIKLMEASKEATKAKKTAVKTKAKAVKVTKAAPKSKKASAKEIADAIELLKKDGYTVSKVSPRRKRGEY